MGLLMGVKIGRIGLPSVDELRQLFLQKYGTPDKTGWGPRRRFRFGYYVPADVYEATVKKLVCEGCRWVDVGGGHSIFPDNPTLARSLVSRCSLAVGVDPSDNIEQNEFVHQGVKCFVEDYQTDQRFDLATLRMVVEHVQDPVRVVKALHRLLQPGGLAVVFTVNRWSPITLLSGSTPHNLHQPIKKFFWGGEDKDTFPVQYKMNTRQVLRRHFEGQGFRESAFAYLDDLSTLGAFYYMSFMELLVWRLFGTIGHRFPENCLLGVYQRSFDS
jgi:SAM-dependent methyltransferase